MGDGTGVDGLFRWVIPLLEMYFSCASSANKPREGRFSHKGGRNDADYRC